MRPLFITALLALCLWSITSCQQQEEVAAKIGNQIITAAEFKARLQSDFRNKKISELSEADRRESMEKLLDDYRKVMMAKELGLDKDPTFLKSKQRFYDRLTAVELYQQEVVNKLVPESLLRQYFDWQHYKIKAVCIKIGHRESPIVKKNRSREEALALAKQLTEEFRAADPPEDFAREKSDDKKNRPVYDPYKPGIYGYKADSLVYSAQPGEVVGPVDSERGYVIFRILERVETPRKTRFEDEKQNLIRLIRRSKAKEERKMFEELSEEFRTKYNVQIFDENIQTFFERMSAWGARPDHKMSDFTEEDRELVFAEINGQPLKAAELLDFFQSRLLRDYKKFGSADDIKKAFVLSQVNLKVWALEGQARGLQNTPKIQRDLKNFEVNHLAKLLEEKEVNQKISVSDEEIETYYQEHQEKYKVPEKIKVAAMAVQNEQAAKKVVRKLKAGVDFAQLVTEYGQPYQGQPARSTLGFQTRKASIKEYQAVVEKAFELGPYQIAGPVMIDQTPFVIKTGELQPAKLKPLDQVKNLISTEIYNRKRNERLNAFLDSLKVRYAYRINETVLRRIS